MHDKEQLKIYQKTSSKTYIEWLYNYILSLPGKEFDDVDVLEQPQTDDTKKAALLSYFLVYVHELAQQQNIKSHIDIDNEFEELNYNIKIFDKFFNIRNMTGNFDITLMREITMPRTPYVIVL